MKKIGIFLITIISLFLGIKDVYAEEHMFYEGEMINNIYMSKYKYSNNTIYYQQARTFRNTKNGEIAYCIEPLIFFNAGSSYQETLSPRNLSSEQLERIKKIAYFGYQYEGHYDLSWYAVAQMMIWKTASPYEGDYYFTETLNGTRTNKYDWQINEINNLIDKFDKEISIKNQTITLIEGTNVEITIGEDLKYYTTNNQEIEIQDNKIIINNLKEGEYDITLQREIPNYHNGPIVIYQAQNSQNLLKLGNLEEKNITFKIKVISNYLEINKVDADTKENIPQGDASLDGSIFELYKEGSNEVIGYIEIINGKGLLRNIPYGTYYLKEIKAGTGYQLNETIYKIEITEENPNIEITVENKVIEKKIKIEKKFGEGENLKPEAGIVFEIYNKNNELVKTIVTDENGEASFTLPYGEYTIVQVNTTVGYQKVDSFPLIVDNTEDKNINLIDYKIKVPNTHKENGFIILSLIKFLILILC